MQLKDDEKIINTIHTISHTCIHTKTYAKRICGHSFFLLLFFTFVDVFSHL